MDQSTKLIGHHRVFIVFWNRLFKFLSRWLCLYPALIIICYYTYFWLRFAEFLDLDTYKIVPARLLGFFYNLTNWEGVNIIIYNILQLPIFLTLPVFNFITIFIFFQTVIAMFYLAFDTKALMGKLYRAFLKV